MAQFATTAVGSITKRRWGRAREEAEPGQMVAFVRRACFTYHHPVGTRAIGPGRDAVVDSELRVRGIQGLRIDAEGIVGITEAYSDRRVRVLAGGGRTAGFRSRTYRRG